ncbi:MAG: 4-hydroxybutyrate CoA-transferase [Vicinamibacteria bacterium]|nr:4-hydroxybutyrate CoA-transferase [Vicinamibacteria bacterium]
MKDDWKNRIVFAEDAVALIKNGMNVYIHGACASPVPLLEAMVARKSLTDVTLYHLHVGGEAPFARPENADRFHSISFFAGANVRGIIESGQGDFVPVFLSDIPGLFTSGVVPIDVAMIQVSPPDKHGLCTLGTSCDSTRAAVDSARIVIAEINDQMPRTHGYTAVPLSKITAFIHTDRPLVAHIPDPIGEVEARIGQIVADLVVDGATLQMGIGAIPDAVLSRLKGKRNLGIHTEMFSDGLVELVESGAVTGALKTVKPGRIVTSFVFGSKKVFDFVDDNPLVEFHPSDRTNDTSVIRRNDNTIAINSALQVDLSGQVCADSLGHRIYSGIGGQMDFMRGAALSRGGKPILALPSTAKGGKVSRIAPELAPGAGVVTTRGHVQWIVTEFGAVNLHGLPLRKRGEALISIAHPDFRAELSRDLAKIRHFVMAPAAARA